MSSYSQIALFTLGRFYETSQIQILVNNIHEIVKVITQVK